VTGSGNVTGLNVVRALAADRGIDVVGCDIQPWNPADRYCRNYTVPLATHPDYLGQILEIVKMHQVTAVIPSNDHELRALATEADRLEVAGVRLNGRSQHQLAFLDKSVTTELFDSHGIATPRRVPLDGSILPMVVRNKRAGQGTKNVHIVRTGADREALGTLSPADLVATEYVAGDEFTVDILSDLDGKARAVVPRLRRIVRHGIVHFGEIVRDPTVIQSATVLAERLRLTGVNCAQCIRQGERCEYFEVNPRPGSGIDLTVAGGINMPALWVRLAHGQTVEVSEPAWGLKLIRTYDGYFFR
jgi:carbamoyl-phosphate synthase large subunit